MNSAAVSAAPDDVQGDDRWMCMHERYKVATKEREPEVLLLGDSIFYQVQFQPIWDQMFVPLHCLNFGLGGDQTQQLLWRIQNGELDNITPKVIVILIGTNNHDHDANQVALAIIAIADYVHEKQPLAQIVVVGLPPRGQWPNRLRTKIATINSKLQECIPSVKNCQFLSVDSGLFINSNGEISHHDLHDYLHFTNVGYHKLLDPVVEEIQTLLKDFRANDE